MPKSIRRLRQSPAAPAQPGPTAVQLTHMLLAACGRRERKHRFIPTSCPWSTIGPAAHHQRRGSASWRRRAGRMRILVVEDEVRLAALLRHGLAEEGHAVDVVGSGEDALDWIDAAVYDVLVL